MPAPSTGQIRVDAAVVFIVVSFIERTPLLVREGFSLAQGALYVDVKMPQLLPVAWRFFLSSLR